jgi:hypothetical protein
LATDEASDCRAAAALFGGEPGAGGGTVSRDDGPLIDGDQVGKIAKRTNLSLVMW